MNVLPDIHITFVFLKTITRFNVNFIIRKQQECHPINLKRVLNKETLIPMILIFMRSS